MMMGKTVFFYLASRRGRIQQGLRSCACRRVYRRAVGRQFVFFVVGDIGVELAEVLMAESLGFQFHKDMALEYTVIEDEIHEEMFVADEDAFLLGFEA